MKAFFTVFLLLVGVSARADISCVAIGDFPITSLSYSTATGLYSVDVQGSRLVIAATYKVLSQEFLRFGTVKYLAKVEDLSIKQDMPDQLILEDKYYSALVLRGLNLAFGGPKDRVVFKSKDCIKNLN